MSTCFFVNPDGRTGQVRLTQPECRKKVYFPLFNQSGMMSAITPEFKGDLKLSQNEFHLHPMVTEDLYQTSYSRNFWVIPKKGQPWSVTGVSAHYQVKKGSGALDHTEADFIPGLIDVRRDNADLGISARCQAFVPSNGDTVEVMVFTIRNDSAHPFEFAAVPAVPIYARSADNQRDHRQVTTMLNRIYDIEGGVDVCPVMSFDERGHRLNTVHYAVMAFDESGRSSSKVYKRLQDYIGETGSLDAPNAIYQSFNPPKDVFTDGREAMAAFYFDQMLAPGESVSFIVINAIASKQSDLAVWARKYRTLEFVMAELEATKHYWYEATHQIAFETADPAFDNWFCWVAFQPLARKVFGCSFLPDFGYGRGGRGWRDLWQDCLALILTQPADTKELLFQNFGGIRADGSNATIIGRGVGEFIADRNNITRTWMDHGVWPLLTLNLYIQQTGDLEILFRKQTYFKDLQSHRSRQKDTAWSPSYGNRLLTKSGDVYEGTVLEHLLIQNVTQFFNVGEHHICRLEGADWNDGLDMARDRGESVAFHSMYMHNLCLLADYLKILAQKQSIRTIQLFEEVLILFDTFNQPIAYGSVEAKVGRLDRYMTSVAHQISGQLVEVSIQSLIQDLETKAQEMKVQVQAHEVVSTSEGHQFFNGYYDNQGKAVEGDHPKGVRMTLTGQVFPIMSGLASPDQVKKCFAAAGAYLKDRHLGGYRLNTYFGEVAMDLGRAFSFSYGDKENGAFFSHMIVMFMYALYSRGFVQEGYEVFQSIYHMCMDFDTNQILPMVPEYFDGEGRGAYLYLTGSASWMVITLLTQMFGVTAQFGDLVFAPKLVRAQFEAYATVRASFNGIQLKVTYDNPHQLDYGDYTVQKVMINDQLIDALYGSNMVILPRQVVMTVLQPDQINDVLVVLG